MRICDRNIPVGIVVSILLLSLFFTALPNSLFVDLRRVDICWGCPATNFAIEHSIDGDWRGFAWDHLFFDIFFWVLYFSLLGLGGNALLRKIRLKIHPGFCLVALWIATALLYAHLYRPDLFINAETGGFLGFLESPQWQVDMAMRFGDVEKLQTLFRKHPELISSADVVGRTPLHEAAYWGQIEIVRFLLANRANVHAKDRNGRTPLFGAATCGFTGAAELLIKSGANVNVMDDMKETPLMPASGWGNNSVVLLLLANKADVNARDNNGETPLFQAVENGKEKTVELLLSNGADVSVPDKYGMTPIQIASANGYTNIVEILKRHSAIDNGHAK